MFLCECVCMCEYVSTSVRGGVYECVSVCLCASVC